MDELLQLADRIEALGVAALLFIALVLVVRYFKGVIKSKDAVIADLAEKLQKCGEARLEDQKEWAERYKDGSVRMETALQDVARATGENQRALERLETRLA